MCGFSFCADALLTLSLSLSVTLYLPIRSLYSQLNATLEPLQCFDANMLKMLPTELIAFGKLLPASAVTSTGYSSSFNSDSPLASRQMQRTGLGSVLELASDKDVLHISVNGLHRWTPQFENHIWKHLGKLTP